MHVLFIPYGHRGRVEILLREMEAQKHKLTIIKGKKVQSIWIDGQIRLLPFGIYEYIFPKEDLDLVLNTLNSGINYRDRMPFTATVMRKVLKCKKIPEFETKAKYLWNRKHTATILIGIREDEDMTEITGKYKGWKHEQI